MLQLEKTKKEFEELKQQALKEFPVFDFLSQIHVRKIIQWEWSIRRFTRLKRVLFQGKVLDYNRDENLSTKDYYLDSSELSKDDQKDISSNN
jgi:hypothetical protein